ncbi:MULTISPECIES: hypothetical protein [Dyadobacter]|uniref:hypothetical protein n=1 Tax=Dyadobacter TaxID=120831 RepID=UPI0014873C24|nr:hypothetical protein [Dyadobacter sediminis]
MDNCSGSARFQEWSAYNVRAANSQMLASARSCDSKNNRSMLAQKPSFKGR